MSKITYALVWHWNYILVIEQKFSFISLFYYILCCTTQAFFISLLFFQLLARIQHENTVVERVNSNNLSKSGPTGQQPLAIVTNAAPLGGGFGIGSPVGAASTGTASPAPPLASCASPILSGGWGLFCGTRNGLTLAINGPYYYFIYGVQKNCIFSIS